MSFKDYYAVLGVKPDTPPPEIKRAFRKLARQYHPDVSKLPDAENKFKEINEAWEVLQDPAKKVQYDEIFKHGGPTRRTQRAPAEENFYPQSDEQYHHSAQQPDFSEFFNSIFGNRGSEYRPTPSDLRGQDLHATLRIPLQLAYQGGSQTLTLQLAKNLPPKTLKVKIPAGITDKSQIRLKEQGQEGGAGKGDLYIEVQIEPHPFYSLHHKDIHLKLPITPWEAALGANLAVPTLGGSVNLKIPPNSQSEQKLRLKGRGLPGQPPGDQYVILQLVLPQADTAQAQALYQTMAKDLDFNPREKLGV